MKPGIMTTAPKGVIGRERGINATRTKCAGGVLYC